MYFLNICTIIILVHIRFQVFLPFVHPSSHPLIHYSVQITQDISSRSKKATFLSDGKLLFYFLFHFILFITYLKTMKSLCSLTCLQHSHNFQKDSFPLDIFLTTIHCWITDAMVAWISCKNPRSAILWDR